MKAEEMKDEWIVVGAGRPYCWGETADGRQLFCVYEFLDDITIIPVTAYEV
jgi:hypothetical protein